MPQKAKFTKDEILEVALNIVRKRGFDSLTARNIGENLKSSTRPIFTVFDSMEELKKEVNVAARNLYDSYVEEALKKEDSDKKYFKCVGEQYIKFSIVEPRLFQLLFMQENEKRIGFRSILPQIENNYEKIILSIEEQYKISREKSIKLYHHLWIYTHGIASLCATKMCTFTDKEISNMLTEVFKSILKNLKEIGGEGNDRN